MKTYRKVLMSKLVAKFDNELKNILMNDIKVMKSVNNLKNNGLTAA
ncbi:MAG: hypothetical protein ABIN95_13135 [Mucilaginibacter sp.]